MLLHPNPVSSDQLTFTLSEGLNHTGELFIMDAAGKIVLTQEVDANNEAIEVEINDLNEGIYYYTLTTDKHTLNGKFIRN